MLGKDPKAEDVHEETTLSFEIGNQHEDVAEPSPHPQTPSDGVWFLIEPTRRAEGETA